MNEKRKPTYWKTIRTVLIISLIFSLGFVAGSSRLAQSVLAQGSGAPANTDKLFAPFWEAWNMVHDRYVDPLNDDTLMQGAITGMVASIGDPHTAYMDPQLYSSLTSELSGSFDGIGATVKKDTATGGLTIVSTIAGAPARTAGLKSGDIVVTVGGQDVTSLSETEIVGKVRGPAGSTVKLGVLRKGFKNLIQITVTRAKIVIPTVTTAMYKGSAGNIGYIKLAEFSDNAGRDLRNALQKLNAEHLSGLIFDLRDNPGGGLMTAIDVASEFIKSGPISIERGRTGTQEVVFKSTGQTLAPTVPMVVLINEASASASELVSGALHDRGRATLVGVRSYGKGSVQQWSDISNGGGIRVTIAHFFTPTNRVINGIGLTPDVIVPWDQDANPDVDVQLAAALRVLNGEF